MSITEFILARVAEKEAFAKGAIMAIELSPGSFVSLGLDHPELAAGDCPGYIRDYEPERDLVECDAMRAIVEWAAPILENWPNAPKGWRYISDDGMDVLKIVAAIWADHDDYRAEWA